MVIYRLNATLSKIPMAYFTELEQIILKVWNDKRPQVAKAILKKKNIAGESCSLISNYTTKLPSSKR